MNKRTVVNGVMAGLLAVALTSQGASAFDLGGKKAARWEEMVMGTAHTVASVVNPPAQVNGHVCTVAGLVSIPDYFDVAGTRINSNRYGECGVQIFVRPDVLEAVDRGEVSRLELAGLMAHEMGHAVHGDALAARRASTTLSQREHEADIEGARIMFKLAGLEGVEAMAHFFETTDRFKQTDAANYGTPAERGAAIRAEGKALAQAAAEANHASVR